MAEDRDFYDILHVRPDAPTEVIRASYRTMMHTLRMHPDHGGCTDQAARVTQAYQTLTDPGRRARYDRARAAGQTTVPPADEPAQSPCLFCQHPIPASTQRAEDSLCGRCGSPLAKAARHRLERSSRRMLRRSERRRPLRIRLNWGDTPLDGMMLNLSLNGLLLECAQPLEPNRLIRIDSDLCRALARVSHCRRSEGGQFRSGVEFVTLRFNSPLGTFVSEHA